MENDASILLDAVNDDGTIEFNPQSRTEEYLKSCINKTGIEGLSRPQSRIDALLYILSEVIATGFIPKLKFDSSFAIEAAVVLLPDGRATLLPISSGVKSGSIVKRNDKGDIRLGSVCGDYKSDNADERIAAPKFYVDAVVDDRIGDIETVLDEILELQDSLIGGGSV